MKNSIQKNLGIILEALYVMPKELISSEVLQEKTQLSPEEINDACDILESSEYVELLRYSSTHPFDFGNIQITSAGRFEFERVNKEAEENHARESSPEIIEFFDSSFVSIKRIEELSSIKNDEYDLSKLIILLNELNDNGEKSNVFSIAMILRAIIDHIPQIFKKNKFSEVLNNYSWTRSNRVLMERLDSSLRNIADSYLHTPIRKKEIIPSPKQVDFRAELDVLLCEIISILK